MNEDIQTKASKIVALFQHNLDDKSAQCLNDNDYENLAELIMTAISEERLANAELVEALAHKIKTGVKRVDLGL